MLSTFGRQGESAASPSAFANGAPQRIQQRFLRWPRTFRSRAQRLRRSRRTRCPRPEPGRTQQASGWNPVWWRRSRRPEAASFVRAPPKTPSSIRWVRPSARARHRRQNKKSQPLPCVPFQVLQSDRRQVRPWRICHRDATNRARRRACGGCRYDRPEPIGSQVIGQFALRSELGDREPTARNAATIVKAVPARPNTLSRFERPFCVHSATVSSPIGHPILDWGAHTSGDAPWTRIARCPLDQTSPLPSLVRCNMARSIRPSTVWSTFRSSIRFMKDRGPSS